MSEPPDLPEKPHSIWPGLALLGGLILLVLCGMLTGTVDPWGALGFAAVAGLILPAPILAAVFASLVRDGSRVVPVTKALCPFFAVTLGLSGYAAAVWWFAMPASREAFSCLLFIFAAVGGVVAPFSASYAVYRHARREGKTHEEAQKLSRWDPGRFGMK